MHVKTMRPAVSRTRLYSYLVTRPTGRAVRLGIQDRLAEFESSVLTVLDFREVALIDFSCADEVVVKLVLQSALEATPATRRFFLFSGVNECHRDPIDSALRRRSLAVAAEDVEGHPVLLGAVDALSSRAWYEVCRAGRAAAAPVARTLGIEVARASHLLDGLVNRALLLAEAERYVSFRCALAEDSAPRQ